MFHPYELYFPFVACCVALILLYNSGSNMSNGGSAEKALRSLMAITTLLGSTAWYLVKLNSFHTNAEVDFENSVWDNIIFTVVSGAFGLLMSIYSAMTIFIAISTKIGQYADSRSSTAPSAS